MSIENIRFDLISLIYECLEPFRSKLNDSSVELLVQIDQNLPRWYNGDPSRLRQIMINLVGNAVKFTQEGYILINLSHHEGEQLTVYVQDTGIGVSPERQEALFKPFEQADNSTARKFGGTGLGLAICRRLAELMGGEISLKSAPGEGSTFSISLGFTPEQDQQTQTIRRPGLIRGKQALLVYDSAMNRKILKDQLSGLGVHTVGTSSCAEVAEQLEGNSFDVVMINMRMEEKGGMALASELRPSIKTSQSLP